MELLRIEETADRLRISRRGVYRLINGDPDFPQPIRVGSRVVFDLDAIDGWLNGQAEPAPIERMTVQQDA